MGLKEGNEHQGDELIVWMAFDTVQVLQIKQRGLEDQRT